MTNNQRKVVLPCQAEQPMQKKCFDHVGRLTCPKRSVHVGRTTHTKWSTLCYASSVDQLDAKHWHAKQFATCWTANYLCKEWFATCWEHVAWTTPVDRLCMLGDWLTCSCHGSANPYKEWLVHVGWTKWSVILGNIIYSCKMSSWRKVACHVEWPSQLNVQGGLQQHVGRATNVKKWFC